MPLPSSFTIRYLSPLLVVGLVVCRYACQACRNGLYAVAPAMILSTAQPLKDLEGSYPMFINENREYIFLRRDTVLIGAIWDGTLLGPKNNCNKAR